MEAAAIATVELVTANARRDAVRVGLIARAEDRGIGIQTYEFARHVQPDRVAVVDMGPLARGFEMHMDRYPNATIWRFENGQLPESAVRSWLGGLDVVYSVETVYDIRLIEWARAARCRTIVHVNPEFFHWNLDPRAPVPDRFWLPTTWRSGYLPRDAVVVPVPVALDRFQPRIRERAETFLHVAGHTAAGDRNGTNALMTAARYMRQPSRILVLGQDRHLPSGRTRNRAVRIETRPGGVDDYWRLYDDGDVLVMPRRYGGLCLPVQEAMAAGMGVVMTDVEPQRSTWPVLGVRSVLRGQLDTPGGRIEMANVDPSALARVMDSLVADPPSMADLSSASICWAQAHSWDALLPTYVRELAAVVDSPLVA